MPSAYERRLVLFYLSNAVSRLRGRDEEAPHLVQWLRQHEEELQFRYPTRPDDIAEGAIQHGLQDREVPTPEWQRFGEVLRNAWAAARPAHPDRTARRIRRLAKLTCLSRTDAVILELALRYQTGSLVGSLIDDIGERTQWNRRGFKLGNPVLPSLLGLSAGTVHGRFAPDGPLVSSGLLSVDDDGDVTLLDRLTWLHWLPKEAGSDVRRLLLDEAGPGELHWSDFDHVAGDRDHLERLLSGALRCNKKGVNVLVYGPPGTGKTEFCKTLAARLETPLYVVGESDATVASLPEARGCRSCGSRNARLPATVDPSCSSTRWRTCSPCREGCWSGCTAPGVFLRVRPGHPAALHFRDRVRLSVAGPSRDGVPCLFRNGASTHGGQPSHPVSWRLRVVRRKAEILACLNEAEVLAEMLRAEGRAKPERLQVVGFRT